MCSEFDCRGEWILSDLELRSRAIGLSYVHLLKPKELVSSEVATQ